MADGKLVLLALALKECQLAADTDDEVYNMLLSIEADFQDQIGRNLEKQSFTEYFNIGKLQNKVFLKNYPVATSPTVQVWEDSEWTFGSDDALTINDDFKVDYDRGIVMLDIYDSFEAGHHSVKVTYTAGYDTSSFPANAARILARQTAHWYHMMRKQRAWIQSETTPAGGAQLQFKEGNYLPEYKDLVERWSSV